jgi:hypothetical protein
MNGYVDTIWVVFKLAKQEMVEWAAKKQPEGSSADNMGMNCERYITDTHVKVLCTPEGA